MQVLLWRPAELLNGRMAMIGFVAALGNEALTGASLWQQLYFAPYAYFFAYFLVVVASQLNRAFGRPQQGGLPQTAVVQLLKGTLQLLYCVWHVLASEQPLDRVLFGQLPCRGVGVHAIPF